MPETILQDDPRDVAALDATVAEINAAARRRQSVALAGAVLDAIFAVDPDYDGPCPGTGLGDGACPACGHPNTRRHAVEAGR